MMLFIMTASAPLGSDSKKVSWAEFASIGYPCVANVFLGFFRAERQIENNAPHRRILLQNTNQQFAQSAADVHQCSDPREVICREQVRNRHPRDGNHGLVQ